VMIHTHLSAKEQLKDQGSVVQALTTSKY